jgi:hypothetical protein
VSRNIRVAATLFLPYLESGWEGPLVHIDDGDVRRIVFHTLRLENSLPIRNDSIYVVVGSGVRHLGACSMFCGYHDVTWIGGTEVKYAFIADTSQCPSVCAAAALTPATAPNGDFAADGMTSVLAHELAEAVTDPVPWAPWGPQWSDYYYVDYVTGWHNLATGDENADMCAWQFGKVNTTAGGKVYNVKLGTNKLPYLLQQNFDPAGGGGCTLSGAHGAWPPPPHAPPAPTAPPAPGTPAPTCTPDTFGLSYTCASVMASTNLMATYIITPPYMLNASWIEPFLYVYSYQAQSYSSLNVKVQLNYTTGPPQTLNVSLSNYGSGYFGIEPMWMYSCEWATCTWWLYSAGECTYYEYLYGQTVPVNCAYTLEYTVDGSYVQVDATRTLSAVSLIMPPALRVASPPPPPPSPPMPPASDAYLTCPVFNASNTAYTTQNYGKCLLSLIAGTTYTIGNCCEYYGDTELLLADSSDTTILEGNDDYCSRGSQFTFTPTETDVYTLREGCFSSGSCGGTVNVAIGSYAPACPAAPASPPAPNTNGAVYLVAASPILWRYLPLTVYPTNDDTDCVQIYASNEVSVVQRVSTSFVAASVTLADLAGYAYSPNGAPVNSSLTVFYIDNTWQLLWNVTTSTLFGVTLPTGTLALNPNKKVYFLSFGVAEWMYEAYDIPRGSIPQATYFIDSAWGDTVYANSPAASGGSGGTRMKNEHHSQVPEAVDIAAMRRRAAYEALSGLVAASGAKLPIKPDTKLKFTSAATPSSSSSSSSSTSDAKESGQTAGNGGAPDHRGPSALPRVAPRRPAKDGSWSFRSQARPRPTRSRPTTGGGKE